VARATRIAKTRLASEHTTESAKARSRSASQSRTRRYLLRKARDCKYGRRIAAATTCEPANPALADRRATKRRRPEKGRKSGKDHPNLLYGNGGEAAKV
jgi:hypothetical protein